MVNVGIATHNGSDARREHNRRNPKVVSKENHIEAQGDFEIWLDIPPRVAYQKLFQAAVDEYNAKQQREDRKIKDYYNQIVKDKNKHPVYEMIVGVYAKDGQPLDRDVAKAVLLEHLKGWMERNPNLQLCGLYFHNDETSDHKTGVHVHVDYIPVAHNYSRGPSVQTGLVKALGEMGFQKQGKETAQIQWQRRENQLLEDLCRKYGLNVVRPEKPMEHIATEQYRATKDLETTQAELVAKEQEIIEKSASSVALDAKISQKKKEVEELIDLGNEVIKELSEAQGSPVPDPKILKRTPERKTLTGRVEPARVEMYESEYQALKHQAQLTPRLQWTADKIERIMTKIKRIFRVDDQAQKEFQYNCKIRGQQMELDEKDRKIDSLTDFIKSRGLWPIYERSQEMAFELDHDHHHRMR